jgi:hypothetical protein
VVAVYFKIQPRSWQGGNEGKQRKISLRIADVPAEIQTGHVPNTIQKHYRLNHLARARRGETRRDETRRDVTHALHVMTTGNKEVQQERSKRSHSFHPRGSSRDTARHLNRNADVSSRMLNETIEQRFALLSPSLKPVVIYSYVTILRNAKVSPLNPHRSGA